MIKELQHKEVMTTEMKTLEGQDLTALKAQLTQIMEQNERLLVCLEKMKERKVTGLLEKNRSNKTKVISLVEKK